MGRRHKGPRRFVAARMPMPLAHAAAQQVPDRFDTISDLVQAAFAEMAGMPQYAPTTKLGGDGLFAEVPRTAYTVGETGQKIVGGRIPEPLWNAVSARFSPVYGPQRGVLQAALAAYLNMPEYAPERLDVSMQPQGVLTMAG